MRLYCLGTYIHTAKYKEMHGNGTYEIQHSG